MDFNEFKKLLKSSLNKVVIVGPDSDYKNCRGIGVPGIYAMGFLLSDGKEAWITVQGSSCDGKDYQFLFQSEKPSNVNGKELDLWKVTRWPPFKILKAGISDIQHVVSGDKEKYNLIESLFFQFKNFNSTALVINKSQPHAMDILFDTEEWHNVLSSWK